MTRVMGTLNVTPDSFSDGGRFLEPDKAVERAFAIAEEGADLLDIGAESTRPGAEPVPEEEERRRLWPVLERLAREKFPLPVSLDCAKPALVAEAWDTGWIAIVNDVEGLRNPEMVRVVRERNAPVILMHMWGTPRTMQQDFRYGDVVADLIAFFRRRIEETGLAEQVTVDPGIGFGKSVEQNLEILRRLREFGVLGRPILVGASRKSFIGKVLDLPDPADRLEGSLAAAAVAAMNGASIVRVHDVRATVRFLKLFSAAGGTPQAGGDPPVP
jgi:dihydropteroate synthase